MSDFNPSSRLETDFRLPPKPETRLEFLTSRLISLLSTPILTRGVDLSHWNGEVDFTALKASGIDFVILKATEGTSWVDSKFSEYWRSAHSINLPIMTYHFFRSNYGGFDQAKHHVDTLVDQGFLSAMGYKSPVMWADVESEDGATVSQRQNRLLAFHQTIEALSYQSGHYSSPYLWDKLLNNVSWGGDYWGWNAHWTSGNEILPSGWTQSSRKVWQYGIYPTHGWVEPVSGTPGAVDCNWFFGSLEDLNNWLGITPSADCCEELKAELARIESEYKAEVARLELEVNSNKVEINSLQQSDIQTEARLINLETQGADQESRLTSIEELIQSARDILCG
jgi:lysozyme